MHGTPVLLLGVCLLVSCGRPEPRVLDSGNFGFHLRGADSFSTGGYVRQRRLYTAGRAEPSFRIEAATDSGQPRSWFLTGPRRLRPGSYRIARGDPAATPDSIWLQFVSRRNGGTFWSDSGRMRAYIFHGSVAAEITVWLSRREPAESASLTLTGAFGFDRSIREPPTLSELLGSEEPPRRGRP